MTQAFERIDEPTDRVAVRHNQLLSIEELWKETTEAVKASGKRQVEIAEALSLSVSAVNKALKEPEPGSHRYADVQARIIRLLTGYAVEREVEVRFRARKVEK